MKYQVWVKAHDPKTLAVIADVLVFEHEDRLAAERYNERGFSASNAKLLFGIVVLDQEPIYSTETRIPGWGAVAGTAISGGRVIQRCQCQHQMESQIFRGRCAFCQRPV